MKRFLMIGALAALTACGYSEDKFADESAEAFCTWAVDCFEMFESVDACLAEADDDTGDDMTEGCTYNSDAAKQCVDELNALTCDDSFEDYPSICNDVYTDCPDDTAM